MRSSLATTFPWLCCVLPAVQHLGNSRIGQSTQSVHANFWRGAAGLAAAQGSSVSLAAQQSFASSADVPLAAAPDEQETYPQPPAQPQSQPAQTAAQSHAYLQQNALQKYQAAAQNIQPPEDDMELIMDTGIAFASTYVAPQATNRQGQMDQPPADDDVRPIHCCPRHDACLLDPTRELRVQQTVCPGSCTPCSYSFLRWSYSFLEVMVPLLCNRALMRFIICTCLVSKPACSVGAVMFCPCRVPVQ